MTPAGWGSPRLRPESAKCEGRGAGAPACAARGCLFPKPRRGKATADGPGPPPPAPSPPLRCAAPAALHGLQKTWAPPSNHSPSQGLVSAGSPRAAPHRTRVAASGPHLPSQAPVGRGKRALRGYSWSAQSAEERAPLRLFPRTPPGGVRPARPLRLLTPAATLLPSPPRAEPQPLAPTAGPAAPAPAELRRKHRRTGWVSFGIHGCLRESHASYPR